MRGSHCRRLLNGERNAWRTQIEILCQELRVNADDCSQVTSWKWHGIFKRFVLRRINSRWRWSKRQESGGLVIRSSRRTTKASILSSAGKSVSYITETWVRTNFERPCWIYEWLLTWITSRQQIVRPLELQTKTYKIYEKVEYGQIVVRRTERKIFVGDLCLVYCIQVQMWSFKGAVCNSTTYILLWWLWTMPPVILMHLCVADMW